MNSIAEFLGWKKTEIVSVSYFIESAAIRIPALFWLFSILAECKADTPYLWKCLLFEQRIVTCSKDLYSSPYTCYSYAGKQKIYIKKIGKKYFQIRSCRHLFKAADSSCRTQEFWLYTNDKSQKMHNREKLNLRAFFFAWKNSTEKAAV